MSTTAIKLEEERLKDIDELSDYNMVHERHRIFPAVFEDRDHKTILDISAGVGVVGKRIKNGYPGEIVCNDITPKCLSVLKKNGLKTISNDLDTEDDFDIKSNSFDAVISLATIEHIINVDNFVRQMHRILNNDGYLYISAPNCNGLLYILPVLLSGKTFHDPMSENTRYEFFAHVRYFTYRTLVEYVSSFGFTLVTVYVPLPKESSKYLRLKKKSKFKAFIFRSVMGIMYRFFSPRWASEPVLCFKKGAGLTGKKAKKKIM